MYRRICQHVRSRHIALVLISVTFLIGTLIGPRASARQRPVPQSSSSGLELDSIDQSIDPCVDFYQFACGGWMARHPVPPDLAGIGRGREMRERAFAVLRRILTTPSRDVQRRKASDYYAACMDEAGIDAKGIESLQPVLSRIDALDNADELPALAAYLHRVAFQFEITLRQPAYSVLFDFRSERYGVQYVPSIRQGGIALPARDLYLSTDARAALVRERFRDHVQQILMMLGASTGEATSGARAVLTIETALAAASADAVEQRALDTDSMPLSELRAMTPHFDWDAYFNALSVPTVPVVGVVGGPAFIRTLEKVVAETPLSDLKHYLRWQVVHASVLLLPAQFRQVDFDFFKRTLKGQQQLEPRSELCITETDDRLGDVLGRAFVEETFPPRARSDMLSLAGEIKAVMSTAIDDTSWMSDQTKKAAKAKLDALVVRIGYPNRWKDYSTLRIATNDALGNFQRAVAFERTIDLGRIGRPVDRDEWPHLTASRAEAVNRPQLNDVLFPAGFLQPPMYREGRDSAANYGAIGAVIGHEVTHGFDDIGKRLDSRGNWSNWWTDSDSKQFQERASCIADQYSQYGIADGAKVNGRLTLGENIADNGGIRLALMAYLAGPGRSSQTLDGFTGEQRVFLAWAQVWCVNVRPEAERLQIQTDPHSPNRYRVNGPLSNMPEFQKAFSCKADAPMVRQNACRVW